MNWFANQRQEWIGETLRVFGFINRHHLVRKFGISVPQASADLQTYQRNNPQGVIYDKTLKRYVSVPFPAFSEPSQCDSTVKT